MMEIAQILEELAYDMGELPREAIEAAIAMGDRLKPHLLDILKDAVERVEEVIEHDNYQGHLYALYLLAQLREASALPLVLKLISFPGDMPHAILGDVLTEDLHRILASFCGSHPDILKPIIENAAYNEYVRAAALASLVTLVGCKSISREEVVQYLYLLVSERLEKSASFVWDQLVACCCELHPEELYFPICHAYSNGLVNSSWISLETVSQTLQQEKELHLKKLYQNTELIEDTLAEMEKWLSPQPMLL